MPRDMNRRELIARAFPEGIDPLWCPLLTHYIVRHGRVTVDPRRMAAQLRSLCPYVRQFLLGGSTGDGWNLDPQQSNDLVSFAAHEAYWPRGLRFLIGVLAASTPEVIRRATAVVGRLGDGRAPGFVGVAVCPPVKPGATQEEIREHYARLCSVIHVPVAVYQLPQVTGCRIAPETFARLVGDHANIFLFKDSGGTDEVAKAGQGLDGVVLVRGAEGRYVESLKSAGGAYDGLLLSTANVFAYSLRNLVDMAAAGERDVALRVSSRLTRLVERIFGIVRACPSGNPFSNANRAVDHLVAHGAYWSRVEPPMLFDGSRLPTEILEAVAAVYDEEEGIPEQGYFLHRYVGMD